MLFLEGEDGSVSTQVQEDQPPLTPAGATPSARSYKSEDTMLEMMEEARVRSPPEIKYGNMDESGSSDDGTLESPTKEEIAGSPGMDAFSPEVKRWKEPLEAAVRECKRVREKLVSVQESFAEERGHLEGTIQSQKKTIETLEAENGRLSLSLTRSAEETEMAQNQLVDAKQSIDTLQNRCDELDKGNQEIQNLVHSNASLKEEKAALDRLLSDAVDDNNTLETTLHEINSELADLRTKYQTTSSDLEDAVERYNELESQLQNQEEEFKAKENEEVVLLRQALQQAEDDLDAQKETAEMQNHRLGVLSEEKGKMESMLAKFQSARDEDLSNAEDRAMEAECKMETMRTERAELKSRLFRVEKELSTVKEGFVSYKTSVKEKLQEREQAIRALHAESSGISLLVADLKNLRENLHDALHMMAGDDDIASATDASSTLERSVDANSIPENVRELRVWRDIVPTVTKSIKTLAARQKTMDQFEQDIVRLKKELKHQNETEDQLKCDLESEREHSEKLVTLLQQAEGEMEMSTSQIQSMSAALASFQERSEESANQIVQMEEALNQMQTEREEHIKRLSEAGSLLQVQGSELSETSKRL